jgi:hypothetical protein
MPAPAKPHRLYKITFGGWYQRTTLHLSEIYEYFSSSNSYLELDKNKLRELHSKLEITEVTREFGYLEYIYAKTKEGIGIKYYEDGLYTLEISSRSISQSKAQLEKYFDDKLNPAINYIFSLGAPIPKILANIKTHHPTVISFADEFFEHAVIDEASFGEVYSRVIRDEVGVFKTPQYIFIAYKPKTATPVDEIIGMQIFFREFKDQLEKYLNIHRKIWTEISNIKERKEIVPKDVGQLRARLDSYQKTISLISNRINQMGTYVKTRKSIAQKAGADAQLVDLFQYRFEVLIDTLEYIKEIWKMTSDYVTSAIQVFAEIQAAATNKSIQSLTLITSVGVIAGLVGYLSRDTFPKITFIGIAYLCLLLGVALLINETVKTIQSRTKRRMKFSERDETI